MRHQVKYRCSSELIKFHTARWFSINAILLIFCHIDYTCADHFLPRLINSKVCLKQFFLLLGWIYLMFYFEAARIIAPSEGTVIKESSQCSSLKNINPVINGLKNLWSLNKKRSKVVEAHWNMFSIRKTTLQCVLFEMTSYLNWFYFISLHYSSIHSFDLPYLTVPVV